MPSPPRADAYSPASASSRAQLDFSGGDGRVEWAESGRRQRESAGLRHKFLGTRIREGQDLGRWAQWAGQRGAQRAVTTAPPPGARPRAKPSQGVAFWSLRALIVLEVQGPETGAGAVAGEALDDGRCNWQAGLAEPCPQRSTHEQL